MSKKSKKICDPDLCDECMYVGDGGFACMKDPTNVVIVIDDFEPTEDYLHCQKKPKPCHKKPCKRRKNKAKVTGK